MGFCFSGKAMFSSGIEGRPSVKGSGGGDGGIMKVKSELLFVFYALIFNASSRLGGGLNTVVFNTCYRLGGGLSMFDCADPM